MLFKQPLRYSEDIGLVQTRPEPIGVTVDAIRNALSWLGKCSRTQAGHSMHLVFKFAPEIDPQSTLKLKVEINTREHASLNGTVPYPFTVESDWYQGKAEITSFTPDELFGTKLRALLQRNKGRDLFDLHHGLKQLALDTDSLIACFKHYLGWSEEAYRRLRAGPDAEAKAAEGVPTQPRMVEPEEKDRYVTCVPFVPLKAAAGMLGDPQSFDENSCQWVSIQAKHRLRPGMFVAQVVGRSMEPMIPSGSYCLFRAPVEGTREGKTVLVQLRERMDAETGERYTVKRYDSTKAQDAESWRHTQIRLRPTNPDFEEIRINSAEEGELQVIAEVIEVI